MTTWNLIGLRNAFFFKILFFIFKPDNVHDDCYLQDPTDDSDQIVVDSYFSYSRVGEKLVKQK
jgi:hypothetical protein